MKGELNSPFLFYECILFLIKIIIGMKIDALFISDVHLGTKGSNSEMVLEV